MKISIVNYFLRLALATAFLSAVADRFGLWPEAISAWGNWSNFTAYTALINPLVPKGLIPALAGIATAIEVLLAVLLLTGFKTVWVARTSGVLLLLFGLAMTFSTGIKGALDYSVFTAAAAAFALAALEAPTEHVEMDLIQSTIGGKRSTKIPTNGDLPTLIKPLVLPLIVRVNCKKGGASLETLPFSSPGLCK